MGVVAECTHLALNERVAVKMLRQDVLLDHDAVQRFVREAQAAVKLKSEYVARVSDVGTFENGTPYMVMEFLEGHDLGELLKQRGVLPVAWACELVLQTAEALAEAHSLSIVHRDVKPTNLFVTWRPDGSALIKVLDFGISKAPMGADMQLTQTQSLLGTPAYMSPEQMRSARLVDSRTDIWSLGTVLYEILEGRRPFEADSFSEMCVKVAVDAPAPMLNTPPQLQPVIMRCLAKTPEQRYPNMAELARDLIPFVADPHSATVLVERMGRMLRRSHVDWEGGGTGVGRQAVPPLSRDMGSAPVRASTARPNWGIGSDPAAKPWDGKSDPSIQPYRTTHQQDGSAPFARSAEPLPDATLSAKRNRWPLILTILGVLTMTGVGVGLYVSSLSRDSETPADKTVPAASKIDAKPVADPKLESKTDPKLDPKLESKTDPKLEAKTDPKIVPKTDPKLEAKTDPGSDPKHPGVRHPLATTKTPKVIPTQKLGQGANANASKKAEEPKVKTPAKEPETKEPKDQKPCDPFDSMHGCGSNSKQ
ncbi:MAG: Serine/threonine protein kinase PrkC, regulator of stationary phase [Myxococcales bacterium]|nr:Serine/threonine protein kinase PrkC, regulator of stationary phase [Myxococcales bacterium]